VLDGVQNLRNHVIGELDLRICQPDNGGYQHGWSLKDWIGVVSWRKGCLRRLQQDDSSG